MKPGAVESRHQNRIKERRRRRKRKRKKIHSRLLNILDRDDTRKFDTPEFGRNEIIRSF